MNIVLQEADPDVVLKLNTTSEGVAVIARCAGVEQMIISFTTAGGVPSAGDPLGQRGTHMVAKAHKLKPEFPAKLSTLGCIEIEFPQ